jgi:hypothetical protein
MRPQVPVITIPRSFIVYLYSIIRTWYCIILVSVKLSM